MTDQSLVPASGASLATTDDTSSLLLSEREIEERLGRLHSGVSTLERFINNVRDLGIQSQLLEAIALNLPDNSGNTAQPMLAQAVGDVIEIHLFGGTGEFDVKKVVAGAASLDLLVRYALKLRAEVFPREDIPSPQLVDDALVVFHHLNRQRLLDTSAND